MAGPSSTTAVDHVAQALEPLPAHRLGSLLRSRRTEARVTAAVAARAAGIKITALDAIESGHTPPDATLLAALLSCYGVAPGEFVPPRAPLATTASGASGDEVLRGYVDTVRTWRKSGRNDELKFRANDILILGDVLGTDPDEIERRLIAITGCSPSEARLLRKWLLAALVTIPVAASLIGSAAPSAAAAMRAASPVSAVAGSAATVAQGTVKPGSLSLTVATPKLGAVRVDGSIPLTESYVITDARGSGAGWSVQATFTSTDATASPTSETLVNLSGDANLPQTPALPATLSSVPAVVARAAPGTQGMGRFAGHLELSIDDQTEHSSGDLTLTFAPPASA